MALLAAIICVPALAADPKPDATIKNKTVEASVFLDGGIKADPALAADCLAEGRKWIDKQAAGAASQRKTDPQMFRDGAWSFERKYDVRSVVADRYVSILRSDYVDAHAAHPSTDVDTILWDRTAQKRISIGPFFTGTADNGPTMQAILKAVIASLNIGSL